MEIWKGCPIDLITDLATENALWLEYTQSWRWSKQRPIYSIAATRRIWVEWSIFIETILTWWVSFSKTLAIKALQGSFTRREHLESHLETKCPVVLLQRITWTTFKWSKEALEHSLYPWFDIMIRTREEGTLKSLDRDVPQYLDFSDNLLWKSWTPA